MTSTNTQISDDLLAAIYRGTPAEARTLALNLSSSDQARLAIFCNGKAHLRAYGREIASICTEECLQQEGGLAGVMLFRQVSVEPDHWGAVARTPTRTISLGVIRSKAR